MQHPDALERVVQRTKAAKQSHSTAVTLGLFFAVQAEAMVVVVVEVEEGKSARALTHLATLDSAIATGLAALDKRPDAGIRLSNSRSGLLAAVQQQQTRRGAAVDSGCGYGGFFSCVDPRR